MNAATADAPSTASRIAALVANATRGIRWPQVRGAMLFGLAVTILNGLVFLHPIIQFAQTMPLTKMFLQSLVSDQIKALCLLVAIVAADRAVNEGAGRRAAYVAAALGGCLAGVLLSEPFNFAWRSFVLPNLWPAHRTYLHGTPSLFYHPIFQLTHWLLIGGAAVFLYADRRAARRTAQLLHSAELDRLRRSKLALESRLQAMQARVEPQFLFNTLAQVERLYELDPDLAGRMLDDLIAYLRAAMPKMRDTSSTVAQEIELVRAYLAIVRIRLGNRLEVSIDAPAELADVRLPPMMLLPLVDHAVVHGLEPAKQEGSIRIAVSLDGERLRLTIADTGAGFVTDADGAGIDSIRERLTALYGEKADLTLCSSTGGGTEALMEIPYEPAAAT